MAMQQSTKARLGATRLVLEQTVMCSDYVAISELQSKALIDMLGEGELVGRGCSRHMRCSGSHEMGTARTHERCYCNVGRQASRCGSEAGPQVRAELLAAQQLFHRRDVGVPDGHLLTGLHEVVWHLLLRSKHGYANPIGAYIEVVGLAVAGLLLQRSTARKKV